MIFRIYTTEEYDFEDYIQELGIKDEKIKNTVKTLLLHPEESKQYDEYEYEYDYTKSELTKQLQEQLKPEVLEVVKPKIKISAEDADKTTGSSEAPPTDLTKEADKIKEKEELTKIVTEFLENIFSGTPNPDTKDKFVNDLITAGNTTPVEVAKSISKKTLHGMYSDINNSEDINIDDLLNKFSNEIRSKINTFVEVNDNEVSIDMISAIGEDKFVAKHEDKLAKIFLDFYVRIETKEESKDRLSKESIQATEDKLDDILDRIVVLHLPYHRFDLHPHLSLLPEHQALLGNNR